jgi:hypothetical protein
LLHDWRNFYYARIGRKREQRSIITSAAVTSNHRIDHLESVRGADERAPC